MKQSLAVKVSLPIFLLLAMALSLTSYIVHKASTGALQDSITSSQTNEAKQTMDKLDRFLYERNVEVKTLAGSQQIQDFLALPAATRLPASAALITKRIDDFKNSSGTWSEVSIIDSQGIQPLGYNLQDLQASLAKQPSVLKLFASALSGHSGYSDALIGVYGHEPIMLFMTPVYNETVVGHPVVGAVVGELAWQTNLDILRGVQGTKVTLINKNGLSLGDNQPGGESDVLSLNYSRSKIYKNAQNGGSESGVYPGLDDPKTNFLTSYARDAGYLSYRGNSWILIFATPVSTAFAPARHLDKVLIISSMAFFILLIFTVLGVLNYLILIPLSDLKKVTGRLTKGDFSLRTSIKSNDEFGRLGKDFNNMADNLQATHSGLRKSNEQAQQARRTTQAVLEDLPVGVLVVEAPSGKPIMMNRMAQKISGRVSSELDRLSSFTEVYELLKEDGEPYPEAERPLNIALKTGKVSIKEDAYIKRQDDEPLAVRLLASPIKLADGSFKSVVSLIEDISEDRNLERSREEFFSIASHELRTPLTAIRGNTSLIQQFFKPALKDPELNEMVNDIHESSIRLIDIVNDFLDTSRLEQKRVKYELAEIDMVQIAESSVKEYVVTGSRRKIHMEVIKPSAPLPAVWADSNRAKQVLINLVGNALKFTESGSITIGFSVEATSVKTLITDTGQGMDKSARQKLFRKFEQTGSQVLTRDSVKGTGLGLYISKMLVEQMNGSIRLEHSEPGKGTTFSFSLPLAKSVTQKKEETKEN